MWIMFWILLWVLQSFLNATWMILTKKVVENKVIWNNLQTFFNRSQWCSFTSVSWSSSGLLAGSYDKTIKIWNPSDPSQERAGLRCLKTLDLNTSGNKAHRDVVQSVAWNLDGTKLVTGSNDNVVKLWDNPTQTSRDNPTQPSKDNPTQSSRDNPTQPSRDNLTQQG